ncbi:MAG TPA: FecR domain-containing protein [Sphingomicrobium sp.]|nr:FecR domain-containing protein [Sphingomicrobium sp.]
MSRAQQIEERAALWVLHREEPSWSSTDQAELDEWLAQSDAHKAAFWRIEAGWRAADRIASLGTPLLPVRRRFDELSWGKPLALAASLVLVFTFLLPQWPHAFGGAPQPAQMEYATPIGGHRIVSLPDGSRIELNTDTAIRAVVDDRGRAVWLDRGEAFFEIARHRGRKFLIYAGPRVITVLGTKFSVRRSPSEVVVAVVEGSVSVDSAAANAPDRHATVTAGDVAIASGRSTSVTNSAEAVRQQLVWRSGRLVFDGIPLVAAVEQFNRYNQKKLVIGDPGLTGLLVAGSFSARNIDAFVQRLRADYSLDTRDSSGGVVLTGRQMASRGSLGPVRSSLIAPRPKNVIDERWDGCRLGRSDCAVVPLAPVSASSPMPDREKALRDASNWDVLHKLYPPRALAGREEGLVGFTVKIDAGGNPTLCRITHSSGHPLLDLETCQLIMVHATFKRAEGLSRSQQRSYEGVVNWKLPTPVQPAATAAPQRIAQAAPPEPLVCKRIPKTGSNAAFERRCMTKSDWQRASDDAKNVWDRLRSDGASCAASAADCR